MMADSRSRLRRARRLQDLIDQTIEDRVDAVAEDLAHQEAEERIYACTASRDDFELVVAPHLDTWRDEALRTAGIIWGHRCRGRDVAVNNVQQAAYTILSYPPEEDVPAELPKMILDAATSTPEPNTPEASTWRSANGLLVLLGDDVGLPGRTHLFDNLADYVWGLLPDNEATREAEAAMRSEQGRRILDGTAHMVDFMNYLEDSRDAQTEELIRVAAYRRLARQRGIALPLTFPADYAAEILANPLDAGQMNPDVGDTAHHRFIRSWMGSTPVPGTWEHAMWAEANRVHWLLLRPRITAAREALNQMLDTWTDATVDDFLSRPYGSLSAWNLLPWPKKDSS